MTVTSAVLEQTPDDGLSDGALRRLQRLAAVLAIGAVLETLVILAISARGDQRFRVGVDLATIGFVASILLFPVVGALIVQRRPVTRVAWLMIALGVGLGIGLIAFGVGIVGMPPSHGDTTLRFTPSPVPLAALVVSQVLFLPSLATVATVLLLLFPTD